MKKLVAVRTLDIDGVTYVRGFVARQKNRKEVWRFSTEGKTPSQCGMEALSLELQRAEREGPKDAVLRIQGTIDDR